MNDLKRQQSQLPPDAARYLKGAPPESRQFDFLIGHWDVGATRYREDGAVLFHYKAGWSARYLNEGRMVMDDFKAYAPTGEEISSFVTLRTYSEVERRWEMAGLAALQPAANAEWHGMWNDGEMHLEAVGKGPGGGAIMNRIRFFDIETNSFKWESRISKDDGKTWVQAATLVATREVR